MNKKLLTSLSYLTILFILTNALLAGCGSTTSTVTATSSLSTASRLALGTLKLEGTSQAVTASQAAQLLTLWQGYQSLNNSDTSSQVELAALVKQIESTMTSDQIKAVDAMELTDQSVSETLSTLGGNASSGTPASTPNASALSQAGSSGGSGGMLSGGSGAIPSGGPRGMPSGGDASGLGNVLGGMTAQSTSSATQSPATNATAQVNSMLLGALIQLLETRSQSAG